MCSMAAWTICSPAKGQIRRGIGSATSLTTWKPCHDQTNKRVSSSASPKEKATMATLWWSEETVQIIHSPHTCGVANIHSGLAVMNESPVEEYWARGKRGCTEWEEADGWLTKGCLNGPSDGYFQHVLLHPELGIVWRRRSYYSRGGRCRGGRVFFMQTL